MANSNIEEEGEWVEPEASCIYIKGGAPLQKWLVKFSKAEEQEEEKGRERERERRSGREKEKEGERGESLKR